MLRPKKRTMQKDCSGSSIGSEETSEFDSSVCYDAMSPSNVTVSLQTKSSRPPDSRHAGASYTTTTSKSLGSGSVRSLSFGSMSTVVSQSPSLAESIGNFDADKAQTEERKVLVRACIKYPRRCLPGTKNVFVLRANELLSIFCRISGSSEMPPINTLGDKNSCAGHCLGSTYTRYTAVTSPARNW